MKEAFLRNIFDTDWITIILCVSILSIVFAKRFFYGRFINFIILPFNNKYIFLYNKKDKLSHWFTIFFSVFQFINLALFIYLINSIFGVSDQKNNPYFYVIILVIVILYIVAKVLLLLANAFIFNISSVISEFIFKKISYLNYSSLIMFGANILLTYVVSDSKTVVYASLLLIILINGIGWITVLKNHQKLITNNFFYFILYLCALEITPLVLIGDYFKD
ncbi:DUF4271 domain-containing protein [Cellulophaga sp. HaHaR_3_176]|uniref:DUF4271 domain-containing protein n=1 Tax=Cellulophaga sp. HaHaR_3_176 TaxID=1942464 RepID=UPI001C1F8746|nr:DUF4271 domain-containing protein [Cellulophaga sp. HaHaR_3_176]QWX83242.1 DUF4271 domain-containing protein [Cellulophaga sp. HaHaR_3_176]